MARAAIFGIPVATVMTIMTIIIWIVLIDPILTPALEQAFDNLGQNSICPPEFTTDSYKICFDGAGNVIVDGKVQEPLKMQFQSNMVTRDCDIGVGNFYFEFTSCQFNDLKKVKAYDLFLISSNGRLSLSSSALESYLLSSSYITSVIPKKYRPLRKLLALWKFIPK